MYANIYLTFSLISRSGIMCSIATDAFTVSFLYEVNPIQPTVASRSCISGNGNILLVTTYENKRHAQYMFHKTCIVKNCIYRITWRIKNSLVQTAIGKIKLNGCCIHYLANDWTQIEQSLWCMTCMWQICKTA